MQDIRPWECGSTSSGQEILRFLWNQKFIHYSQRQDLILNHLNHNPPPYLGLFIKLMSFFRLLLGLPPKIVVI
jgi:hypothetical protein